MEFEAGQSRVLGRAVEWYDESDAREAAEVNVKRITDETDRRGQKKR